MAVVSVGEMSEGRGAEGDSSNTTFTRQFRVITDDRYDGPYVVSQAPGLPRLMDTYSSGNDNFGGAKCTNIRVEDTNSREMWIVTATYETRIDRAPDPSAVEFPWLAPPSYSWGSENYVVAAERGKEVTGYVDPQATADGRDGPIVNTAGNRIAVEVDAYLQILSIDRAVTSSVSARDVFPYVGKVNNAPFLDFDPWHVRMRPFQLDGPLYSSFGTPYQMLRLQFAINPSQVGWRHEILNAGYTCLIDGNEAKELSNMTQCEDAFGAPVTEPWPLKQNGERAKPGTDQPIFLLYEIHEQADLNPVLSVI